MFKRVSRSVAAQACGLLGGFAFGLAALTFSVSARANVIEIENETLTPQGTEGSVDIYAFVYEDGGQIVIATSDSYKGSAGGTLDPVLFLLEDGTIVAADNNSGGNFEARLQGTLPPGEYSVAVMRNTGQPLSYYQNAVNTEVSSGSAFRGNQVGTYDVTITASGSVYLGSLDSAHVPELSADGAVSALFLLGAAFAVVAGRRRTSAEPGAVCT